MGQVVWCGCPRALALGNLFPWAVDAAAGQGVLGRAEPSWAGCAFSLFEISSVAILEMRGLPRYLGMTLLLFVTPQPFAGQL